MQSDNTSYIWRATDAGSDASAPPAAPAQGTRTVRDAPDTRTVCSAPDCACTPAQRAPCCRQPRRLRLVLAGLPAAVAEPAALIADILGWEVTLLPPGPAMRPPADLCLAAVPADAANPLPPITIWSPERNLNEHISSAGLSNLDQPPCVQQLEQLLSLASSMIIVRGYEQS